MNYINILKKRYIFPSLVVITTLLIAVIPLELPSTYIHIVFMDVIVIFYWIIYYPKIFSPFVLIIIGVLHDSLYGTVIGVTTICYIIVQYLILSQRKLFITQPFIVIWLVFSMFSFVFILLKTILVSLTVGEFVINRHLLFQWLFISFVYPIFHILFNSMSTLLPKTRINE
ncbi:hypothetical protein NOVO_08240 [Rickettsiales bacterium Ac37b]|nr:hypothetical protein NOVO_08240 [Rickettsiales bacterium Ac37b]